MDFSGSNIDDGFDSVEERSSKDGGWIILALQKNLLIYDGFTMTDLKNVTNQGSHRWILSPAHLSTRKCNDAKETLTSSVSTYPPVAPTLHHLPPSRSISLAAAPSHAILAGAFHPLHPSGTGTRRLTIA